MLNYPELMSLANSIRSRKITQQLQYVFERASGLSPEIQIELAQAWLTELEDEI
jgi:hypothetical protein